MTIAQRQKMTRPSSKLVLNATSALAAAILCLGAATAQESTPDVPSDAPAAHAKAQRKTADAKPKHAKGGDRTAAPPPPSPSDQPPAAAAPQVASTSRICTLSRETIVASAAINVTTNQRLAQLRQGAQAEIAAAMTSLQNDTKILDGDKRSPSDDGLKKAREGLADRSRAIAQRADLLTRELEATRQSVNVQIQNAAGPIIEASEKEHSCTLLLAREGVIDSNGTVDITQPVLAEMNAKLHPRPFELVTSAEAQPR